MHVVIRRYRVRLGTMDEAVRYLNKWFLPLMRRIPGFAGFQLMGEAERVLTTLGMFETAQGAAAAGELAGEWFGKEWGSFRILPPEVIGGRILMSATRTETTSERRRFADRRTGLAASRAVEERRTGVERRALVSESQVLELRAAV